MTRCHRDDDVVDGAAGRNIEAAIDDVDSVYQHVIEPPLAGSENCRADVRMAGRRLQLEGAIFVGSRVASDANDRNRAYEGHADHGRGRRLWLSGLEDDPPANRC